jgi:hypothetical protein
MKSVKELDTKCDGCGPLGGFMWSAEGDDNVYLTDKDGWLYVLRKEPFGHYYWKGYKGKGNDFREVNEEHLKVITEYFEKEKIET